MVLLSSGRLRATLQLLLDRVDRKEDIDSLQKQHEQVQLFLIHKRQRPKAAVAARNDVSSGSRMQEEHLFFFAPRKEVGY